MNLRPPSVTASIQTSAFNAIVFQSPVIPNARMSLCTQSVHSFSFPPRPLRTAPVCMYDHTYNKSEVSLCTQSIPSFSFPPHPLRTALKDSGHDSLWKPPAAHSDERLPAHKSLLVRNVVSMLSHRVISRARLYEVIRWSGLLHCAPMMRSKTRWCGVRCGVWRSVPGGRSTYFIHTGVLDCLGLYHSGLERERYFRLVVELT